MTFLTRFIMSAVKKSFGNRKFYALPEDYALKSGRLRQANTSKDEDVDRLIKYIDDNLIGKTATFLGPYGRRKGKEELCVLSIVTSHFNYENWKSGIRVC